MEGPHPLSIMLTSYQLKQCLPLGGYWSIEWLRRYYSLVLDKELTKEDVEQIMTYWNGK